MIPPGYKQMPSPMIEEVMQAVAEEQAARDAETKARAHAYAQVTLGLGVKVEQLTPTQHTFADAVFRRGQGENTHGRGYGFSIPTIDRKPNWR